MLECPYCERVFFNEERFCSHDATPLVKHVIENTTRAERDIESALSTHKELGITDRVKVLVNVLKAQKKDIMIPYILKELKHLIGDDLDFIQIDEFDKLQECITSLLKLVK